MLWITPAIREVSGGRWWGWMEIGIVDRMNKIGEQKRERGKRRRKKEKEGKERKR